MSLNAWINFAANVAQFAIPAALFAWADRAWKPSRTGVPAATPTTPGT